MSKNWPTSAQTQICGIFDRECNVVHASVHYMWRAWLFLTRVAIRKRCSLYLSNLVLNLHKLISDLQIGGKYNGYGSLVHRLHARTRDM